MGDVGTREKHPLERTSGRKRVLVLYLAKLTNIARVLRQIDFLVTEFDVVVAAFDAPEDLPSVEFVHLESAPDQTGQRFEAAARLAARLAGRYKAAYWRDARVRTWERQLQPALPVDAVLVNSMFALPLAFETGAPVVFDSHEHWTSESASWSRLQSLSMRGAHDWLVNEHVPRTAGVMAVSRGIVADYESHTGVKPALVTNAPFYQELDPSPTGSQIRLLHVGLADERRRLEDTIEAVQMLDERFSMDLVLARDNAYRTYLEGLVKSDERIRILPPVPNAELISFANAYDVGVFLLPARFPNQIHVLPNKLFDYIQARLAVAIGPSPEMAAIVNEWDCGVVAESFSPAALAGALAPLEPATIARMKTNSGGAAAVLNADHNRDVVLSLIRKAVRESPAQR